MAVVVKHGDTVLGIILQSFDTVVDIFGAVNIREGRADKIFQRLPLPCGDKVFKIHCTEKLPAFVRNEKCGDIVIILRLCDKRWHGGFYGHGIFQLDKIIAELAAYLVLVKGSDKLNLSFGLIVQQINELISLFLWHFTEDSRTGITVQLGKHGNCFLHIHLVKEKCGAVLGHILEYFRQHGNIKHPQQPFSFSGSYLGHYLCNILAVVIPQLFLHCFRRKIALDYAGYFFFIIGDMNFSRSIFHCLVFFKFHWYPTFQLKNLLQIHHWKW